MDGGNAVTALIWCCLELYDSADIRGNRFEYNAVSSPFDSRHTTWPLWRRQRVNNAADPRDAKLLWHSNFMPLGKALHRATKQPKMKERHVVCLME